MKRINLKSTHILVTLLKLRERKQKRDAHLHMLEHIQKVYHKTTVNGHITYQTLPSKYLISNGPSFYKTRHYKNDKKNYISYNSTS